MRYYSPTWYVKVILLFLPVFAIQVCGNHVHAQVRKKQETAADSAARARSAQLEVQRIERQRVLDSTRTARMHIADSMKAERQRVTDSLKDARAHIADSIGRVRKDKADSLAAIRKYRESKRYQDSVTRVRQQKIDERKTVQQAYFDSVRAERKHIVDSTIAVRKAYTDSIRTVQKKRSDSLAAIRKYKESKRYQDSVAIVRQGRMDSLRVARQRYNDSMIAARKHITDSITAVRTHIRDSITAVRKHYVDSVTAIRKARADSLAKVKEQRLRDQEVMAKNREKRMQLALDLKIKKKREAWSNEKMLKKRWSAPRKAIQNTFTRYNYYFNADHKMDEALRNMQRSRKENYDSLLALFPFDPNRDSTMLASDMDSIIQKTSLGIQIHDPRTKWSDDLYLLMGQAYFYKGDYKNAAVTFKYIVSIRQMLEQQKKKKKKNPYRRTATDRMPSIAAEEKKNALAFMKHRTAHNEGLLWLIRTYAQSEQPEQAESVIELLASDPKFPKHLQGRLALEKSFLYLKEGNTRGASEQLAIVTADKHTGKWLRMRTAYINGQLEQQAGNYPNAAGHFRDVIALHPDIEMDFYSRKHLAYSLMYAGGNQDEAVASLKTMLKDGKYLPYYEQIYFVLGRLAANSSNTKDAITYLRKSIDAPKSTNRQKAVSFATLGEVHYGAGNYTEAKQAYDSAAYLAGSAPGEPLVEVAVKRSQSLDKVTGPLHIISTQDSLLLLASLPEKEQRQVIRRYIRKLEQERNDSIFRAENAMPGFGETGSSGNSNYGNWYFSNTSLMQQGMNDFKRKWGNRKLADNWRRSAASGFTAGSGTDLNEIPETGDENAELDEKGLPTEESLLAAIPTTPERQEAARALIQRAYTDLGNAYISQLEDYTRAIAAMDTLDKRYLQHPHHAEILYMRYMVALKQDRLSDAQAYSERLLDEYPESAFAKLVRPAGEPLTADNDIPVAVFYDNTYALLQQRQFTEVIQRAGRGRQLYNDRRYNPRFTIMEASALAGAADFDQADTIISAFIKEQTADSLLSWAQTIKDYITRNRPLPDTLQTDSLKVPDVKTVDSLSSGRNSADLNDSLTNSKNIKEKTAGDIPESYTYNPREPHYFMFVFPRMETKVMGIRAAITDLNNLQFSDQNLAISLEMLKDQQGVIIVQEFGTSVQAKNYIRSLKGKPQIFRDYTDDEYQLLIISAKNHRKLMADKNIDQYQEFYKTRYR